MKIVVIDGQGGRVGKALVEALREAVPQAEIIAIGTNATATAAMMKAGAHAGATGENPVLVAARTADVIVGPLGIVLADAMLGEITPAMAAAVGGSPAEKVLLPATRCARVVGVREAPLGDYVREAVRQTALLVSGGDAGETMRKGK